MSLQTLEKANSAQRKSITREPLPSVNPRTVFVELFELLEEYGPSWYTEEQHNRAVAAMHILYASSAKTAKPRIAECQL
ncbi:MAG: hypothetical protein WCE52_16055 [Candidatus Acidiferrum sp.]